MILGEFLREGEYGPLHQQVLVVADVDAFVYESKCAKTGNVHTLECESSPIQIWTGVL